MTRVLHDLRLDSPARELAHRLISTLVEAEAIRRVSLVEAPLADDGLEHLHERFGRGLVLDVKTIQWHLSPHTFNFNHYRLDYEARARIVRADDRALLWVGRCEVAGRDAPRARFLASPDFFEQEIGRVLDRCVAALFAQLQAPLSRR